MNRIQKLDAKTADKIAAGEVVERPVSVVKELLENALDSGAHHIKIEIIDGGRGLIQMTDDGQGILKEDIPLAFERYATSKISQFNDLFSLSSFGFRGEALASIASISQVDLATCTASDDHTHNFYIDQTKHYFKDDSAPVPGTTIAVKNLFYNIPARKKFMQSISREFGLIQDVVVKYSLAFPEIDFMLYHQGELVYTSAGYHSTRDLFLKLYGFELQEKLVHVPLTEIRPNLKVEAWLVQEDVNKNTRQHEIFFVNQRLVKDEKLETILEESYYTLIPKGRFPIAFVHLEIPGEEIDVNIHPNKKNVKISRLNDWENDIIELFKSFLWQANLQKYQYKTMGEIAELEKNEISEITEADKGEGMLDLVLPEEVKETGKKEEENLSFSSEAFSPQNEQQSRSTETKATPIFHKESLFPDEFIEPTNIEPASPHKETTLSLNERVEEGPEASKKYELDVKNIKNLQVIGQLNDTFILAQNYEGLYIIDQHTCHERILYERLMNAENNKEVLVQPLLIPILVHLTPLQESTLMQSILNLRKLGFILQVDESLICEIKGIPKGLSVDNDLKTLFTDLLDRLAVYQRITPADLVEEVLTTASCKGAVKANWRLTNEDIHYLLRELGETENPHTCPHGRPIVYMISMQELYNIFERGHYSIPEKYKK